MQNGASQQVEKLKLGIALESVPATDFLRPERNARIVRRNHHFMHNEFSRSRNEVSDSLHEETWARRESGMEL
jgi:hypothetical protein